MELTYNYKTQNTLCKNPFSFKNCKKTINCFMPKKCCALSAENFDENLGINLLSCWLRSSVSWALCKLINGFRIRLSHSTVDRRRERLFYSWNNWSTFWMLISFCSNCIWSLKKSNTSCSNYFLYTLLWIVFIYLIQSLFRYNPK